jgi:hypothetical protein
MHPIGEGNVKYLQIMLSLVKGERYIRGFEEKPE